MNQNKLTVLFLLPLFVFFTVPAMAQAAQSPASGNQATDEEKQTTVSAEASPVKVPGLAEIIPFAGELNARLTVLKKAALNLLDVTVVENNYSEIEQKLEAQSGRLARLKGSEDYNYYKLVEFNEEIKQNSASFNAIGKPLVRAIEQLAAWRKEWLEEKKRWTAWQSSLLKDGKIGPLETTFETANNTIDTALGIVHPQLEMMLALQEKAGDIKTEFVVLTVELDGLIEKMHSNIYPDESPPMYSPRYFSQLKDGIRAVIQKSFKDILWPDVRFFSRVGWIVLIQVLVTLFVIALVFKQRPILEKSERLKFLSERPFSAALFIGYMTTVFIYTYVGSLLVWRLAMATVVATSFARLVIGLIQTTWKKHFIYWLVVFFISNNLLDGLGIPLPLFRLYIFLIALASILLFLQWFRENGRSEGSIIYKWALTSGSVFFTFILIAEIWGKTRLLMPLCISLVKSLSIILVFMMLLYIMHGFLEWLLHSTALPRKIRLHEEDIDIATRRTVQLMHALIWGFVLLPAILMIWGVYYNLKDAIGGLLSLGINLGEHRISVDLMLIAAGVLYGSVFISWILRKLLTDDLLLRVRVEKGVRHAIARLLHYFIVFIAFLLAISVLGFDITKLTIVLSALGVGIGFGLQSIVNNFVSGLILLFERPIRVGDSIELTGQWAEIKRIGLRSTTVQTFDQADVIIPNADLVTQQVTNWTLSSRQVRLLVPVGVAYGSDVSLVMDKLTACANSNKMVEKTPPPQVLFLSFGESSLDFELRVWVEAENRVKVNSELHQQIDKSFREANIEIAFPQRDLHIRSIDKPIPLANERNPT